MTWCKFNKYERKFNGPSHLSSRVRSAGVPVYPGGHGMMFTVLLATTYEEGDVCSRWYHVTAMHKRAAIEDAKAEARKEFGGGMPGHDADWEVVAVYRGHLEAE